MAEKMKCSICGKEDDVENFDKCNIVSIMEKEHVCFHCGFWLENLLLRNEDTFIVDGVYHIGYTLSDEENFKGFGGRNFYVKYNDGRIKHYNDVWCQDDVPKEGRLAEFFKDNAELITKEEYTKYIENEKV